MSDHGHDQNDHGHDDHHGHGHDEDCGHDHGHDGHDDKDEHHGHNHGHDAPPPSLDDIPDKGDDISSDGGCFKKIITAGDASEGTPPPGSKVKVHYVGTLMDGTKFDSSRDRPGFFEFTIGQGQVIKGWDKGVDTMHRGEVAQLICRADYAYGARGHPPTIPADATLKFEIELFSWKEARKEKWDLSETDRIAEASTLKGKGTVAFKAQKWADAQELYGDAADYVNGSFTDEAEAAEAKALRVSCLLNQSQCALKQSEWSEAQTICTTILAVDAENVKALFRRGTARVQLQDFDDAKVDLREASRLDPKSKEIRDMFKSCQDKAAEVKKGERAMMAKMFS